MMELAGLYVKTTADGRRYLAGRLGNARVVIVPNKYRTSGRHPTHRLLLAEIEAGGSELTADEQCEFDRLLARDEPAIME